MNEFAPRGLTLVGEEQQEQESLALNIRPQTFDDYIAQEQMVQSLKIAVEAAKIRQAPLPHVLLGGPPGLGKTTMAYVLANVMNSNLIITSGPNLDKPRTLTDKLRALKRGDILLIDEVHRMRSVVGEILYSALEDGFVESAGRLRRTSNRIDLSPFTAIGCTTHVGDIDAPLRDRMPLQFTLSYYTQEEISQVITRSANISDIPITSLAVSTLARCSRGTPRVANSLLFRARDYALVKGDGTLTEEIARASLESSGIDYLGLNEADRRYLLTIFRSFDGGPVGINAIASSLGERKENLEENVEPYLLRAGLVIRDRAGRVATDKAEDHLRQLGLL